MVFMLKKVAKIEYILKLHEGFWLYFLVFKYMLFLDGKILIISRLN
jgi:hypothetical protein